MNILLADLYATIALAVTFRARIVEYYTTMTTTKMATRAMDFAQIVRQNTKFKSGLSHSHFFILPKCMKGAICTAKKNTNKPKYRTVEAMAEAVDAYFEDCKGKPLIDEDGNAITDKYGSPIIVGAHPPTVTGLALWLGFKTRQSLLNYQARSEAFNDVLTVAKTRCEEYAERRLYDRDGVNGAKFSLTNNFKGWREKPLDDEQQKLVEVRIIDDITRD